MAVTLVWCWAEGPPVDRPLGRQVGSLCLLFAGHSSPCQFTPCDEIDLQVVEPEGGDQ